ncbi:MAG: Mitochondrial presequence protease [Piccolia ochrophora]|nr:MAG: Mitochondrial presequence protease [Piccolia ochrophora]
MSRAISPRCVSRGRLRLATRHRKGPFRPYATVTDLEAYPQPGERLHGFTLKRKEHVPELQLTALYLQHETTRADYLHVARDDKNNVFSIGFKTNPPDHTGVPHILEHTTLCGSKRYPIRDPFFKMLPRSLSNFMNAFTSSDHTSYPFATTNHQDFRNLMSVYIDATLHPLLSANDFAQEGWRIGPANPLAPAQQGKGNEVDKQLVFKGVVYNEMKGQTSDASYLYYIKFQDQIFPSLNNSGGDPQKMTDLTYEQLKKFHADHYHPSNSKIFTYGNMPLTEHLKELGGQLEQFNASAADTELKQPISLNEGPKNIVVAGPLDPLVDQDRQYKTSVSWLMGQSANILETFSLGVMSSLLLDGYGSPLYRSLIEAGLGLDWSPNTGFDGSSNTSILSIGLTGVTRDNVALVKQRTMDTLHEVADKGFDHSKVNGILHRLELGLKHKTANFGMGLMQRLQPGWFNGVDPFDALAWDATISAFKERVATGDYLEGLLRKYLLNDKTLTFTMEPSRSYAQDLVSEESTRLAGKIDSVVKQCGGEAAAQAQLAEREKDLLLVQEEAREQDLSCLPTLHVSDIPRRGETKEVRDTKVGRTSLQWREAATNGLTYFRAVNAFEALPEDLRMYLPLFTDSIMRLGTKDQSVEQLEDLIKLKTGGISASYHSSTSPYDINSCTEGLAFSGFALDRNVPEMYDLMRKVVLETNFESPEAESQIRELVQGAASGAISSIAESGHSYARRYSHAGLTAEGRLNEQISGLTQVQLTTDLAARSHDQGLGDIIKKLKLIQRFALASGGKMRVALTCGSESIGSNEKELDKFLGSLPAASSSPGYTQTDFSRPSSKNFFPLPYQVYYGALALPTVPFTHSDGAPLQVLAQLLTHKHLHHEIREKGGAYGGGAYASGLGGLFGFYSYRDPNPQNSIDVMRSAGQWGRDRQWTDRDIEEAKLSVFQGVDAPESVSAEGMKRFLTGISDEMMQKRREQLLDVTMSNVKHVAQRYLVEGIDKACLTVLGERKPWAKNDDGWQFREMEMAQQTVEGLAVEGGQVAQQAV